MAIHDYDLANAAGLAFRGDLNNVLAAIISQNSNLSEPTTKVAYMFWADTTTAILKQRNAGNTAWNSLLNMTTGKWLGTAATVTVADAAADTTTWPLLARSQTGDLEPATDAGLTYNASTNVLGSSISGNAATATNATNATNQSGGTVAATSITSTGAITSSSPTAGIGYAIGAGGASIITIGGATTQNTRCGTINIGTPTFVSLSIYKICTLTNSNLTTDSIIKYSHTIQGNGAHGILYTANNVTSGIADIMFYCIWSGGGALSTNIKYSIENIVTS